ncbi:MAG: rhodanese-like domain-containing protein [Gammaproteobacteria bacterium]|nr:rhodanese-like domain-containing protein [Gammaproteobacteria bacterium]
MFVSRTALASTLVLMIGLLTQPVALAAKKVSPETVDGATTVNTAEAKKLFDQGITFIDVRSNRDWEAGRIPGSVHIELKKVYSEETLSAVVGKDQPVLIYCNAAGCMRSSKACAKAVDWGYRKVYYYRMGYPEWKRKG